MLLNFILFTIFVGVLVITGSFLSALVTGVSSVGHITGLANYRQLFHDPTVPAAIVTSCSSLLVSCHGAHRPLLAVFNNIRFPAIGAIRVLYFVPAVISFASAVLLAVDLPPGTACSTICSPSSG